MPWEDSPLVLDGELLLDERVDEAGDPFSVGRPGLEVRAVLRARKDAAMQRDEREPFGLAARPAKRREQGRRDPATSGSRPGSERPQAAGVVIQ